MAIYQKKKSRSLVLLEHGQYIMGPEVKELEEKLQAYTGAECSITVASGTEALLISLMAIGIRPGDEIITVPFIFVATAEVIVLFGVVPVFVDIESDIFIDNRDATQAKLNKAGVPTAVHCPVPINEQASYRYLCCPDCSPVVKSVEKRVMSLPMGPELNDESQEAIGETVEIRTRIS